jgi:cell division protein FtsL
MVGAFFLLILVNLIIQAMIAQTQYRINMRQNEINALERRVNLIYLKLADLGSDKRIERIAEEKLEMHPAHADEIAFIPVGRREGTSLNHSKRNHSDLLMAQLDDLDQPGFGQRISEWMQGLGRTLAGTSPAELQ